MTVVGVRQLRDSPSSYLRLVAGGEVVLVTDRGRVVAELRRPEAGAGLALHGSELESLARRGLLSSSAPNSPEVYPLFEPVVTPGAAARLVAEERGKR